MISLSSDSTFPLTKGHRKAKLPSKKKSPKTKTILKAVLLGLINAPIQKLKIRIQNIIVNFP